MIRALVATLLALALAPAFAHAGTTGVVRGTIRDERGAPLSGVRVAVISPSSTAQTLTDAKGAFVFVSVPPDIYTVRLSKKSYEPTAYAGVAVFADQTIALKLRLEPALHNTIIDFINPPLPLIKPGVGADVYQFGFSTISLFSNDDSSTRIIRFTPGVVAGSGALVKI